MQNLERIIELAEDTGGLERVVIWGSFVSNKEFPNDIDLLLVMKPDFRVDEVKPAAASVFDHTKAKIAFSADIFWAKSSIGETTLDMWLETYQLTRDFESRGIIEVDIS